MSGDKKNSYTKEKKADRTLESDRGLSGRL